MWCSSFVVLVTLVTVIVIFGIMTICFLASYRVLLLLKMTIVLGVLRWHKWCVNAASFVIGHGLPVEHVVNNGCTTAASSLGAVNDLRLGLERARFLGHSGEKDVMVSALVN